MNEILELSAMEMGQAVGKGEVSPTELVRASINRIREKNAELNAVINILEDRSLQSAENLEKIMRLGKRPGPLAGVPLAIKDNICIEGEKTTCASKMLINYISPFSADVVERLERNGLIIVAKTNMDEFAMGSTGETSIFGPVKCPLNINRAAGGSSSGSAAAVASMMVPLALGSDTGGSVRLPAAFLA